MIEKYQDYKLYLKDWIKTKPNNGRGELKAMSEFLSVSSVLMSQIVNSDKDISFEKAFLLTKYMGHSHLEQKYFICLVEIARAGHFELKKFYQDKRAELELQFQDLSKRVNHQNVLSPEAKTIFYSNWKFSAARLLTDLQNLSEEDIKKILNVDTEEFTTLIQFLLETNLIKREKGKLKLGTSSTHLSKDSPLIKSHHSNWRLKSLHTLSEMKDDEVMYTAPMTIAKKDYDFLYQRLFELIDELVERAKESKAEGLYYLNIDLRKIFENKKGLH